MKKLLLVMGLLTILAIILFALSGCQSERVIHKHYHRQPRTYVQFEHYWFNNRPYIHPRVIVVQPKQSQQLVRQRRKY